MPQKLDEMVKAISRENPGWPESRVWAVAQSQFKRGADGKQKKNPRVTQQTRGGLPGKKKSGK